MDENLLSIQRPTFVGGAKHKEQALRAKWGEGDVMRKFANGVVAEAAKYQIPLFVHCALRDKEEQDRVFREGFSDARFGQSAHNYPDMAVDIIHSTLAWKMSPQEWAIIGQIGLDIARRQHLKINWGGDETKIRGEYNSPDDTFRWDPAHWERKNWRELI